MAKTRWLIFVVAALAALAIAGLVWEAVEQRDLSSKNRELIGRVDAQQEEIKELGISTNRALCTFKNGLQRSIVRTQKYLDDVASGRRKPIPPEFQIEGIEVSLAGDVTSINTLKTLTCKDGNG